MKFPWQNRPTIPTIRRPSIRDLSDDERADVEYLLSEGKLPSVVSNETGIDLQVVQNINRMRQASEQQARRPVQQAPKTDEQHERQRLRDKIEIAELEAKLDAIKADNEFNREKRELELEIKREELRAMREELNAEDEDDVNPEHMFTADGEPNLWAFLMQLMNKAPRQVPQQTQTVPDANKTPTAKEPIDWSKPQDQAAIMAEIDLATPEELAQIQNAPVSMLKEGLRQRYPGISKENINAFISHIRTHKT